MVKLALKILNEILSDFYCLFNHFLHARRKIPDLI